jgi:hypothetical protein
MKKQGKENEYGHVHIGTRTQLPAAAVVVVVLVVVVNNTDTILSYML